MKKILGTLVMIICLALTGCGTEKTTPNESKNSDETTVKMQNMTINEDSNSNEVQENGVSNESSKITEEDLKDLQEYSPEIFEETKNTVQNFELTSDDTKFVWKLDDDSTAIYYHDKTNITGYEVRIVYDSAEEAQLAKDSYTDYEEDDVESITRDGSTLIVKYKPEVYEGTTLEEIEQSFSLIKMLQENQ